MFYFNTSLLLLIRNLYFANHLNVIRPYMYSVMILLPSGVLIIVWSNIYYNCFI